MSTNGHIRLILKRMAPLPPSRSSGLPRVYHLNLAFLTALRKGGKVVKEGKLRAKFRVVSIFRPPAALIYWPMEFNPGITYDLINDRQE